MSKSRSEWFQLFSDHNNKSYIIKYILADPLLTHEYLKEKAKVTCSKAIISLTLTFYILINWLTQKQSLLVSEEASKRLK